MGICGSAQNSKKMFNPNNNSYGFANSNENNYNNNTNINTGGLESKRTLRKAETKNQSLNYGKVTYLKYQAESIVNQQVNIGGNQEIQDFAKQRVELFLSLSNVVSSDSEYRIVLSINDDINRGLFKEILSTALMSGEEIFFEKTCICNYYFEKEQNLKIEVYDNHGAKIQTQTNTLGRVMGSKRNRYTTKYDGDFELTIEAKNASGFEIILNFSIYLDSHVIKNDSTYFVISNFNDDKNWRKVYKSEENKNKNGTFDEISLDGFNCNNGIRNKKILFEFCNHMEGTFAYVETSVEEIAKHNKFQLIDFNTKSPINNFAVIKVIEEKNLKFIDLLKIGLTINLLIGIDYTSSNGDPSTPKSLHSIVGVEPNPYERAINSCGRIVAYYDYDQIFPVYGFGGHLMSTNITSHCFNVNFSDSPDIKGLENVIIAYKTSLQVVKLSSPTYFSPMIREVNNSIRSQIQSNPLGYSILMIVTDGIITDMDATCDEIVESSKLPLSIIIIGVGNADFHNMDVLDGDDVPLTNMKGEIRERDIVQFVPFNKFEGNLDKLSEEVLFEIPTQIEEYYRKHKIQENTYNN